MLKVVAKSLVKEESVEAYCKISKELVAESQSDAGRV